MNTQESAVDSSRSLRYQQARQYEQFRCLGADCEDTCCSGWQVSVDRETYEKYQASSHPVLRTPLAQWVQIETPAKPGGGFAKIVLDESSCPFLSRNLCSIQAELGADYLGKTCATFPRIHNEVAGVLERSLDFSCPEAARLCLTDPTPASFDEPTPARGELQLADATSDNPHLYFWEIRSAILSVLQKRRLPVASRLLLVGHICANLDALSASRQDASIPQMLDGFAVGIEAGLYDAHLRASSADAADQLVIVLELIAARIKLDYTQPRYLDLYKEFVEGLRLAPGLSAHDCGQRYAQACATDYKRFLAGHEHMLEHYLVHYAYRTLFPFGSKPLNDCLAGEQHGGMFTRHYLILASYFAIVRATMIGLAARHASNFGVDHAIRCIQGASRTLEHCTTYPSEILRILRAKGITTAAAMTVLTQDPR